MKYYIFFLLSAISLNTVAQATITGTVYNAPPQKIYLVNVFGKKVDSATTKSKNEIFNLKVNNIDDETYLKIFYQKKGPGMLNQFVIMPGEHVVFTYDMATSEKNWWIDVTGSPRTFERIDVFKRIVPYKRNVERIKKQIDSTKKESKQASSAITLMQRRADSNEYNANLIIKQVFDTTKSALNGGQMLSLLRSSYLYDESKKDSLTHVLQTRFPNDKDIQSLTANNNNSEEQGLPLNAKAPPIILKDAGGQEIELAKLNAKYIFIDFWASWCKPCRDENPNLVKAYNDFKSKGLRILAVSIDANIKLWTEAIKKDGTSDFIQVIDTRAAKSPLLRDYKLISIPASFLVDKNGTIIAKNLRGDELYKLIDKLTR